MSPPPKHADALCYTYATLVAMDRIASRDLRNDTAGVIRRVQEGKTLIVTVNGRPAAQLAPVRVGRRRWISREDLVGRLRVVQADAGLRDDLTRLAGDTTDDLDDLR